MGIRIIHKNKTYSRFGNNIEIDNADPELFLAGIYDIFKPFESEINAHRGTLTIKVKSDISEFDLEFENIPEDLIQKINSVE